MDGLTPRERRRAEDFVASLATFREGDAPLLRGLPRRIRELLDAEIGSAYSLRHDGRSVRLDEFGASDRDLRTYARDFDATLRRTRGSGYLRYDALRPEPSQRNRVVLLPHEGFNETARAGLAPHGLAQFDQLRVLLCEGPTLLAWVGGLSRHGFHREKKRLLEVVAPAIRRRLLLERHVQLAPVALQLLGAALEAIGAPAFVLRGETLSHANAAGRAALAADRAAVRASLLAHAAGRGDGSYTLSTVASRGAPDHALLVGRTPAADAGLRAAAAAERWALTPRQAQVLALLARGLGNKAIAAALSCGEGTVEYHVTALLAKAGCESRSALVARVWAGG